MYMFYLFLWAQNYTSTCLGLFVDKKNYDEHGQVIPIGYKPIVIPSHKPPMQAMIYYSHFAVQHAFQKAQN
jgi:hypothetical protein